MKAWIRRRLKRRSRVRAQRAPQTDPAAWNRATGVGTSSAAIGKTVGAIATTGPATMDARSAGSSGAIAKIVASSGGTGTIVPATGTTGANPVGIAIGISVATTGLVTIARGKIALVTTGRGRTAPGKTAGRTVRAKGAGIVSSGIANVPVIASLSAANAVTVPTAIAAIGNVRISGPTRLQMRKPLHPRK